MTTGEMVIERTVVEYLANALWQIPLLAGGAWLLLAAGRVEPRAQYRVWVAVLGLAVVLPLQGMGIEGIRVLRLSRNGGERQAMTDTAATSTAGKKEAAGAVAASSATALAPLDTGGRQAGAAAGVETGARDLQRHAWSGLALAPRRLAARPRCIEVPLVAARWMVGLYAGIVMLGLCRMVYAWRGARRLAAGAREITLGGEQRVVLEDYGRRLRIRLPEVRESMEVSSPMIVGSALPVLLLPERFAAHGREEMRAALLHELAHVKRRDYLVNAICRVAALPVVWHPAAAWVQGRIRRTREMACDRMAAEEMRSEIRYARCLVGLAKGMLTGLEFDGVSAGVGLFSSDVLEERVMRLTEMKTAMRMRTKVVRLAGGAAAMVAATAMAVGFHVTPALADSHEAGSQAGAVASRQTAPAPPVTPAAPAAPPAPAASVSPVAAQAKAGSAAQDCASTDGGSFTIVNGRRRPLTPEEKRRVDAAMARARHAMEEATAKLNSPEFKKQIADAQEQASKASEFVNSAVFKEQIAAAQAQTAKAKEFVNSAAFREQIDEVRKATEKLKIEMPKIQIDLSKSMAEINSPEFRRQMEEAQKIDMSQVQRSLDEAMQRLNESVNAGVKDK